MNVFVAMAGRNEAAAALPWARLVDLGNHPAAYPEWLAARWRLGVGFIVVEHDVIPNGVQLDELQRCAGDWCAFTYSTLDGCPYPPLGCAKVSTHFVRSTPEMWPDYMRRDKVRRNPDTHRLEPGEPEAELSHLPKWNTDAPWLHCDEWLAAYGRAAGFEPCLHGEVEHLHG